MNHGTSHIKTRKNQSRPDPGIRIMFPVNPAFLKFCWHLRVGMLRHVETHRIHLYAQFFQKEYLEMHLLNQKRLIESAGLPGTITKKTLAYHRKLQRLFNTESPTGKTFGQLEDVLEQFGRFEQKQLFIELQDVCSHKTLRMSGGVLPFYDHELARKLQLWHDRFWEIC